MVLYVLLVTLESAFLFQNALRNYTTKFGNGTKGAIKVAPSEHVL